MPCPRIYIRLVLFNPQNFRRGKTCQCSIAGDLNKLFPANDPMNIVTLTLYTLVIPQDGGTQNFAFIIEQDQPVHLTSETNCPDSFPADTCFFQHRLDTCCNRFLPLMGILFGP